MGLPKIVSRFQDRDELPVCVKGESGAGFGNRAPRDKSTVSDLVDFVGV